MLDSNDFHPISFSIFFAYLREKNTLKCLNKKNNKVYEKYVVLLRNKRKYQTHAYGKL